MSAIDLYLVGQQLQAELSLIQKTLGGIEGDYRVTLLCRNTKVEHADITLSNDTDPRMQKIVRSMDVEATT